MSISHEIISRVQEGRLIELRPALPGSAVVRRIYASLEINDLVMGPWNDNDWEIRCNQLRADLDRFIMGGVMPVTAGKYNDGKSLLKQLIPPEDEIWEIRSRDPEPSLRVFGSFAVKDTFVALTWAKRADLGGPTSRGWRDAQVHCGVDWRNLFPAYDPLHADTTNGFDNYVSNYFPV